MNFILAKLKQAVILTAYNVTRWEGSQFDGNLVANQIIVRMLPKRSPDSSCNTHYDRFHRVKIATSPRCRWVQVPTPVIP